MTNVDELLLRLFRVPSILVVEDKPSAIDSALAKDYDADVDRTSSGHEAVQMLTSKKYDLIMVDLALLNGTSRKVLLAIKEVCPDVPVIVIKLGSENIVKLLNETGPLTVLSDPVSSDVMSRLFQLFKIKARTRDMTEQCDRHHFVEDSHPTAIAVG